jgi:hypothetical protein
MAAARAWGRRGRWTKPAQKREFFIARPRPPKGQLIVVGLGRNHNVDSDQNCRHFNGLGSSGNALTISIQSACEIFHKSR